MTTLTICTTDGITMTLTETEARKSMFMDENIDFNDVDDALVIPHHSSVTEKVICYMRYHDTVPDPEIAQPLKSTVFSDCVPEWDANLVDGCGHAELTGMWKVADYLNVPGMMNLLTAKEGSNLMGKTTEEMREYMGVVSDLTEEEEMEARKKTEWFKDTYEK